MFLCIQNQYVGNILAFNQNSSQNMDTGRDTGVKFTIGLLFGNKCCAMDKWLNLPQATEK